MQLTIVDVGYGGVGVARTEEGVVFVPGAFTGEVVEAKITSRKKRFAQARLVRVLTPSPDRIEPETAVVPGMTYAALRYEAEVALKQAQLKTLLTRIGKFTDLSFLLPPVASPITAHYRNKLTLRWDGRHLGYVGEDNRTVVDVAACPLSMPAINDFLAQLRADSLVRRKLKPGQKITLRYSPYQGVVVGVAAPPQGKLTESLAGMELTVAADAFFQVNPACAELLLADFKEKLGTVNCVFDLYCGCGLFGLAAAQAGAKQVYGFETTPSAVASAKQNAKALGIRAEYRCAPSECLPDNLPEADLWIVDPPRDGLSDEVRAHLLEKRPDRVAYISCGPDTLARDLAQLTEAYTIESTRLFDFFPRTAHFETLTFLKRK